jgi:hypothetical protein
MHRNTPRVGADDPLPLFLREIGRRRHRLFTSGVVEGEVQATERFDRLVDRSLHVLGPRHVAGDGDRPSAEFLDHAGSFLIAFAGDVGDHDAGALASEGQGGGAADAARGTGHERDLACEASVLIRHSCHLLLRMSPSGGCLGHGRSSALIARRWSMAW